MHVLQQSWEALTILISLRSFYKPRSPRYEAKSPTQQPTLIQPFLMRAPPCWDVIVYESGLHLISPYLCVYWSISGVFGCLSNSVIAVQGYDCNLPWVSVCVFVCVHMWVADCTHALRRSFIFNKVLCKYRSCTLSLGKEEWCVCDTIKKAEWICFSPFPS